MLSRLSEPNVRKKIVRVDAVRDILEIRESRVSTRYGVIPLRNRRGENTIIFERLARVRPTPVRRGAFLRRETLIYASVLINPESIFFSTGSVEETSIILRLRTIENTELSANGIVGRNLTPRLIC